MKTLLEMADSDSRRMWETLNLGYPDPVGPSALRQEIASQYKFLSEEDVLVTTGTEEALQIAFQAIVQNEDHVVAPVGFEPHYRIPESLGASVNLWKPKNLNDGSWKFDVRQLKELVKDKTKLIVLSFPHNPTGSLVNKEELEEICTYAESRGITILSDEVFRGIERNPKETLPPVVDMPGNTVVCSGLSKVYGGAGLRVGWVATQNKSLKKQMQVHHDYGTISTAAPSNVLAIISLRNAQKIIDENRRKIEVNLATLSDFFGRHTDAFKWSTPPGGTIGLAEVIGGDAESFSRQAIEKASTMVVPASVLDHGNKHIRIGYGRANLPEALKWLEEKVMGINS